MLSLEPHCRTRRFREPHDRIGRFREAHGRIHSSRLVEAAGDVGRGLEVLRPPQLLHVLQQEGVGGFLAECSKVVSPGQAVVSLGRRRGGLS